MADVTQAADLADLLALTQKNLGPGKWTDIASTLQNYVAFTELLKRKRVTLRSGTSIEFSLMHTTSGHARNVGMYGTDTSTVQDVMVRADVPWRHTNTYFIFDEREVAMNRAPARILELMKVRRADAMIALAALVEGDMWSKPTDSDDDSTPWGMQYWIVRNASAGFNGGTPTGFTTVAGLSTTTYSRWKNYTDRYTAITRADLVAKMRQAAVKCRFRPPVEIPQYAGAPNYGYYTNYDVIGTMEDLLMQQNDNLGNDIAAKDGRLIFRQVPMTYVAELDDESTDPVYGIDWSTMEFAMLDGFVLRELAPYRVPSQHTVFRSDIDNTWNLVCRDRRKNFIVDKA